MSSKRNQHLFKERITRTDYPKLIQELSDALNGSREERLQLLFGTKTPDLYDKHGAYTKEMHQFCEGLSSERVTEKRLCKCMYYRNGGHAAKCENCKLVKRFDVVGDYRIADYEVPAFYYGDGIGEIDLILTRGEDVYATEVKPYKGNSETLLRMAAEIITYTEGYPAGKYKKAIAFFEKNRDTGEKTPQQKEYEKANPALLALLQKADITVYRFEEAGDDVYQIVKL